jgi:hypothetical protein
MLVRYFLLTLPIHRRSFAEYYEEHDEEVAGLKPEIEKEWGQSWDELPPHIRIYWQDQWYWPPWYYNDIVGYLRVGTDGETAMAGDVYLKRQHFSQTAPERFSRRRGGPHEDEEIVYLASIGKRPLARGDNASYVEAIEQIVEEARELVRLQGDGLPRAEVWMQGFDLACTDWVAADRQLRERFPERVKAR